MWISTQLLRFTLHLAAKLKDPWEPAGAGAESLVPRLGSSALPAPAVSAPSIKYQSLEEFSFPSDWSNEEHKHTRVLWDLQYLWLGLFDIWDENGCHVYVWVCSPVSCLLSDRVWRLRRMRREPIKRCEGMHYFPLYFNREQLISI